MKTTIYTDIYTDEDRKVARDCLLDWLHETGDDTSEPSDQEIYDELSQMKCCELDDVVYNLTKLYNDSKTKKWLVTGCLGLWDGKHASGFVAGRGDDIENKLLYNEHIDNLEIYDDGGQLQIAQYHHDGTNRFIIKELNEAGARYFDRHEYDTDPRVLIEKLSRPRYSRNIYYAKKIFGGTL